MDPKANPTVSDAQPVEAHPSLVVRDLSRDWQELIDIASDVTVGEMGQDEGWSKVIHLVHRRSPKGSQATVLLRLAEEAGVECWHTPDHRAWASFWVDDPSPHIEHWSLEARTSADAREYLSHLYRRETAKAASERAVSEALDDLRAQAKFESPEHKVYLRRAEHEGTCYYDLGNDTWQAVRYDAEGWEVVDRPPVKFWRPPGMGALPAPVRGGNLERLREVVYIPDQDQWTLYACYLLACLKPQGPYRVLEVGGEQGSSKTTVCEMAMFLLDPRAEPLDQGLLRPPKDQEYLWIAAHNRAIIAFDNLRSISDSISDDLCRMSTGAAHARTTKYTDQGLTTTAACLPVIFNGVPDLALNPDLQDRSLKIVLEAIPDELRRPIADVRADAEVLRPELLGVLFDGAVLALRSQDDPPEMSRMADDDRWIHRGSPALGFSPDRFQEARKGIKKDAAHLAVQSSPIGAQMLRLADEEPPVMFVDVLLERVLAMDTNAARNPKFPRDPTQMGNAVRKLAPALRDLGVYVVRSREPGTGKTRYLVSRQKPSHPSHPSHQADFEYKKREGTPPQAPLTQPSQAFTPPLCARHRMPIHQLHDGRWCHEVWPTWPEGGESERPAERPSTLDEQGVPRRGRAGVQTAEGLRGRSEGDGHPAGRAVLPTQARPDRLLRQRRGGPAPGDYIATLEASGALHGRSSVPEVERGDDVLRAALAAVAGARGGQLVLAGRPTEWLHLQKSRRSRFVEDFPAAESAREAGWRFESFGEEGITAWCRARHPDLGPERYIELAIPEVHNNLRKLRELSGQELLQALQEYAHLMGRRLSNSPGSVWRRVNTLTPVEKVPEHALRGDESDTNAEP